MARLQMERAQPFQHQSAHLIENGSTWTLTGDSYVTSITGDGSVDYNGYTLYVNGTAYTESNPYSGINSAEPEYENDSADMSRVYGQTRYDTAISIAEELKDEMDVEKFDNIVIASGTSYPDALSGAYLATVKNAPILLTNSSVETKVANYVISNLKSDGTVYILGGTLAVPSTLETKLSGYNVVRLGGADRYETNLKILEAAGVSGEDVLVCSGKNYPDSLSASGTGMPILLVGDTLTSAQKSYLNTLNSEQYYLIGGNLAVSESIESEIKAYGNGSPIRVGGANRYATSANVANTFFGSNQETVVLAYAKNYPDGLSAGPLAAYLNSPLVLADSSSSNNASAKAYVKSAGITKSITIGGPSLISDSATRNIMSSSGSVDVVS